MIRMKAIITIILVLLFGAVALAHNTPADVKVKSIKMDLVLVNGITDTINYKQIAPTKENDVARLYRFKNSRVKKALAFTTNNNKAKLS